MRWSPLYPNKLELVSPRGLHLGRQHRGPASRPFNKAQVHFGPQWFQIIGGLRGCKSLALNRWGALEPSSTLAKDKLGCGWGNIIYLIFFENWPKLYLNIFFTTQFLFYIRISTELKCQVGEINRMSNWWIQPKLTNTRLQSVGVHLWAQYRAHMSL